MISRFGKEGIFRINLWEIFIIILCVFSIKLGDTLQPIQITIFAEQMRVQRVAPLALHLGVQLQATVLAAVAVDVIAPVHGDHSGHFGLISSGGDGFEADGTAGRESLMVAIKAVGLILFVQRKGYSVQ